MTSETIAEETMTEEFVRLPGLFRQWEIAEVIDVDREFRVEAGGRATDGTRLFAAYQREPRKPREARQ